MKRRFWHRKQKIIPSIFNPFSLMPHNFFGADRNKRMEKVNKQTNHYFVVFKQQLRTGMMNHFIGTGMKKWFKSNAHINILGEFLCFWRDSKLLNAHFHQKFYLIRPRYSFHYKKKHPIHSIYSLFCLHSFILYAIFNHNNKINNNTLNWMLAEHEFGFECGKSTMEIAVWKWRTANEMVMGAKEACELKALRIILKFIYLCALKL